MIKGEKNTREEEIKETLGERIQDKDEDEEGENEALKKKKRAETIRTEETTEKNWIKGEKE